MRMLVVGARSYVGTSIMSAAKTAGVSCVGFSSIEYDEILDYNNLDYFRKDINSLAVVIATPSMHRDHSSFSFNQKVLNFVEAFEGHLIAISTIKTLKDDFTKSRSRIVDFSNNPYVQINVDFENLCLDLRKGATTVLRVTNFTGVNPLRYPNQARLLPYSLLASRKEKFEILSEINLISNPNTTRSFIDAFDLLNALLYCKKFYIYGVECTVPSLELSVLEIAQMAQNILFEKNGVNPAINLLSPENSNSLSSKLVGAESSLFEHGWRSTLSRLLLFEKMRAYVEKGMQENGR